MTILCYGEIDLDIYLALDQLPSRDAAAAVRAEFDNVGGAAANSALWLANWHVATRLAGHDLGADQAGETVMRAFDALPRLDASFVAVHADYRTPRCQCLVTPDGERSFIMHWLDALRITPPSAAMLEDAAWLNLDMSGPLEPRLGAARMARDRDIPVLVNDIYHADHALLPFVDVLVISAAIARYKEPGRDPLDLARELQAGGDCDVIVTDGARDLTVLPRTGPAARITPPPIDAVDTTGAGDIFKSGALYGLWRGMPLAEAAIWGVAAASLMCQYAGTTKTLAPISAVEAVRAKIN